MAENISSISLDVTQMKLDQLSEQIRKHKKEIEQKFKSFHIKLEEKQQSLIQHLDKILTRINKSVQTQIEALFELHELRDSIEKRMKLNKNSILRDETAKKISAEIEKAEREEVRFPDLILNWKNFELMCESMCSVEESYQSYTAKGAPLWCGVSQGSEVGELSQPCGVAINPNTNNIYVVDRGNLRVQIFNKDGIHLSSIKNRDFKKFWGIHLDQTYMYISCYSERKVMRINLNDEKYIQSPRAEKSLLGITVDAKGIVYTCDNVNTVWVYDTRLRLQERIFLSSQYITSETNTRDVKLTEVGLAVLFTQSKARLQLFDLKGSLIQAIVGRSQLDLANVFCVDSEGNYLVGETHKRMVKIFNQEGVLIHSFRIKGEAIGLEGIAVDSNNRIVVSSWDDNYSLQIF